MSQFRTFLRPLLLTATLLLGVPAQAASLLSVSGSWVSAGDASTYGLSGLGTDALSWGKPASSAGQSGYRFDAATVAGADIMAGTGFDIGTFTHVNRAIRSSGAATGGRPSSIETARLQLDYAIDFGGGLVRTFTSVFDFLHDETPNGAAVCANGKGHTGVNGNGCADRVSLLRNDSFSDSFTIGGLLYRLDISGLSAANPFWTAEGSENSLTLSGLFTVVGRADAGASDPAPLPPPPVPLPAAGWMLLAALGATAGIRRRGRVAA